jgi:hypothetical protein
VSIAALERVEKALLHCLDGGYYSIEHQLHLQIEFGLRLWDIHFEHEFRLGPRARIDFRCDGNVGIEVKKGKPNSGRLEAQVERYAAFPSLDALLVIVERCAFVPPSSEIHGKPVRYLALSRLGGVAL